MMPSSKRIQQDAMRWATHVALGKMTPEERDQLQAWLEADSHHRGAYVRATSICQTIERIGALAGGSMSLSRASSPWYSRVFPRSSGSRNWLLAASVAMLVIAGSVGWFVHESGRRHYVSDVGELRQVTLDDGSSMLLSTASKAEVRVDESLREVNLSRGEALFDVAKDPQRPFVVRAGDVTIKAIGTVFAVRHERKRVDVTVTEGVVELLPENGGRPQRLFADQTAVAEATKPVAVKTLTPRETHRQLAWRAGKLEFDGQPLSEAVSQINRYSRRQILVEDADLAAKPVVGVFRSTDTEGFVRIAATAMEADVVEDGDLIRLIPKSAQ